jgi:predicted enzyme related to lactoylglutathione lyase
MNYTMWDPHEGPGGGFSPLGEDVKVGDVLIYVDSDDIDADLRQAVTLGGTIVRPKDEIPNTGWFALFKDSTGNIIGLYTSMNPQ